ncbi:hypothetical protein AADZ90_017110 [Aestuariibius sp. 2305UL40-4]|uniref:hypothetical protein n=1 Tax=Aestuariibius violaceus TaxID=3234132 RepID=UPI00345F0FBF
MVVMTGMGIFFLMSMPCCGQQALPATGQLLLAIDWIKLPEMLCFSFGSGELR